MKIRRLIRALPADLRERREDMKQGTASNLAIALAVVAWPLACGGALSQLGDYAPGVSQAVIEADRHRSMAVLMTGLLCLLVSLWLSGYSFSGARIRSLIATVACMGPAIAVALAW